MPTILREGKWSLVSIHSWRTIIWRLPRFSIGSDSVLAAHVLLTQHGHAHHYSMLRENQPSDAAPHWLQYRCEPSGGLSAR